MPASTPPLLLVYLGDYHLDDPMFMQRFARSLSVRQPGAWPLIVVHAPGETAERALEAQGLFATRRDGILHCDDPAAAPLLERVTREANRRVVGLLTDAVVSAVGVTGTDRRLLTCRPDGRLAVGKVRWLADLARQRVVPVVVARALAAGDGAQEVQVALADAAAALAEALEAAGETVHVVGFTPNDLPGVMVGARPEAEVKHDTLVAKDLAPDAAALGDQARRGRTVWLTNTARLGAAGPPAGTRVV